MAQEQLGLIAGRASAARRLAQALLRSFGSTQVTLRLADAASGDTKSQLGLEPPTQEDVQISPVLVKSLKRAADGKHWIEIVLSQTALQPIAKSYGIEDLTAWLRSSFEGVVVGDQLMRIVDVTVDRYFGDDCLFHIIATE